MDFTGARVINNVTHKQGTIRKCLADYIPAKCFIVYDDGTHASYEFPKAFRSTISFADVQMQAFVDMVYFHSKGNETQFESAGSLVTAPMIYGAMLGGIQMALQEILASSEYTSQMREFAINWMAGMASTCQTTNHGLTDSKKLLEVFVQNQDDACRFLTIVKKPEDQISDDGIYWVGRGLPQTIISTLAQDEREYELNDELYEIIYVKTYSGYQAEEEKWTRLNDPQIQHTIKVFRQKGVYDDAIKGYELVNAKLYFPAKRHVYDVPVYYQSADDSYFMNSETYDDYVRKYGMPKADIYYVDSTDSHSTLHRLNEESRLKQLGYNVQQAEGNSAASRQLLLKRIIQTGKMKDYEVTDHLEFLIHMNCDILNMQNACACWREDLRFVQQEFQNTRRQTDFTQSTLTSISPVAPMKANPEPKTAEPVKQTSTPWKPATGQSWKQPDPASKAAPKPTANKAPTQPSGKPGHAKTNYRSGSVNDLSMKKLELMKLKMALNATNASKTEERDRLEEQIIALQNEIDGIAK